MADQTWRIQPKLMSDATFRKVIARVKSHCARSGQKSIALAFHGGEPCLLGAERFDAWCRLAREQLEGIDVHLSIQTNGTLLSATWAEKLLKHRVNVGVSVDGPQEENDKFRLTHAGRGSYRLVAKGLEHLKASGIGFGVLAVVQFGQDPLFIHEHLISLGPISLAYQMPHHTHDTIGQVRQIYGPTPCADFLVPVFDHWWLHGSIDLRIRNFWEMARAVLGGTSHIDALGNAPLKYVIVSASGEIEGLDALKACEEGLSKTGLHIDDANFVDIARLGSTQARMIFETVPIPDGCRSCPERDTCAGGFHPHRYSRDRGFNNPSVWCADLLKLFGHVRSHLGVGYEETIKRREDLARQGFAQTVGGVYE